MFLVVLNICVFLFFHNIKCSYTLDSRKDVQIKTQSPAFMDKKSSITIFTETQTTNMDLSIIPSHDIASSQDLPSFITAAVVTSNFLSGIVRLPSSFDITFTADSNIIAQPGETSVTTTRNNNQTSFFHWSQTNSMSKMSIKQDASRREANQISSPYVGTTVYVNVPPSTQLLESMKGMSSEQDLTQVLRSVYETTIPVIPSSPIFTSFPPNNINLTPSELPLFSTVIQRTNLLSSFTHATQEFITSPIKQPSTDIQSSPITIVESGIPTILSSISNVHVASANSIVKSPTQTKLTTSTSLLTVVETLSQIRSDVSKLYTSSLLSGLSFSDVSLHISTNIEQSLESPSYQPLSSFTSYVPSILSTVIEATGIASQRTSTISTSIISSQQTSIFPTSFVLSSQETHIIPTFTISSLPTSIIPTPVASSDLFPKNSTLLSSGTVTSIKTPMSSIETSISITPGLPSVPGISLSIFSSVVPPTISYPNTIEPTASIITTPSTPTIPTTTERFTSKQGGEKTVNSAVIGGLVGLALTVVLVACVTFFLWRRQAVCFNAGQAMRKSVKDEENVAFVEDELTDRRTKRPVKLTDFSSHFDHHSADSNLMFSQEYHELETLSPRYSTTEAELQETRLKNRYTNILPFNRTRVKLLPIEDEPGSDYINASYITGFSSAREYIATQGPIASTINDFWRLVWEQNITMIIMLTQCVERGRKKCEQYWPEAENEALFYGDIIVKLETESHLPDYILRIFTLRIGELERRVRHYYYLLWPDMGTPGCTDYMLRFVQTIRADIRPDMTGPILVHCSAGVGRTGTFIALDTQIRKLKSGYEHVDVFGQVMSLRGCRLNMVQTESQYVYLHECIRDYVRRVNQDDPFGGENTEQTGSPHDCNQCHLEIETESPHDCNQCHLEIEPGSSYDCNQCHLQIENGSPHDYNQSHLQALKVRVQSSGN